MKRLWLVVLAGCGSSAAPANAPAAPVANTPAPDAAVGGAAYGGDLARNPDVSAWGTDDPLPAEDDLGGGAGEGIGMHGSGAGAGGAPSKLPPPTVAAGDPTAGPGLDQAIIRRYVRRDLRKIQYCYEKELLAVKGLKGTVTVKFHIGGDGKVTSSVGTGLKTVEDCVATVISQIEFPAPQGGGGIDVNYPFVFKPEP